MKTTDLSQFIELCETMGVPAPVAEFEFHPTREWRFDAAWPSEKIALEVEGGIWTGGRHTDPRGYLKDLEKYNEAAVLGWRIIKVTPKSINTIVAVDLVRRAMR